MKLHVIGIGGIGMKGIAEIANQKGHLVTGSDLKESNSIIKLKRNGIKIFNQHLGDNIKNINAIVVSGAIKEENPEIQQAKLLNIPIWSRMQALDRLLIEDGERISIIGSVGKTTATAIMESVFSKGIKPTVYMGAESKITGENGSIGDGKIAIVESCEYQGAFFDFRTDYIVLTDIVANHENFFGLGIESVSKTLLNFIELNDGKKVFLPEVVKENRAFTNLMNNKKVVTYGIGKGDLQAEIISRKNFSTKFQLKDNNQLLGVFEIHIPGDHLVKHAIPAIALALEFGVSPDEINESLLKLQLPKRRFDIIHKTENLIVIDDNARNPSQLASTVSAISNFLPNYTIVAVAGMWGHLNPRPIAEFAEVLKDVNFVFISGLGKAALSRGGSENSNAIDIFVKELAKQGVQGEEGINKDQVNEKVKEMLEKGPVALLTFGYDSYREEFQRIYKEIQNGK